MFPTGIEPMLCCFHASLIGSVLEMMMEDTNWMDDVSRDIESFKPHTQISSSFSQQTNQAQWIKGCCNVDVQTVHVCFKLPPFPLLFIPSDAFLPLPPFLLRAVYIYATTKPMEPSRMKWIDIKRERSSLWLTLTQYKPFRIRDWYIRWYYYYYYKTTYYYYDKLNTLNSKQVTYNFRYSFKTKNVMLLKQPASSGTRCKEVPPEETWNLVSCPLTIYIIQEVTMCC